MRPTSWYKWILFLFAGGRNNAHKVVIAWHFVRYLCFDIALHIQLLSINLQKQNTTTIRLLFLNRNNVKSQSSYIISYYWIWIYRIYTWCLVLWYITTNIIWFWLLVSREYFLSFSGKISNKMLKPRNTVEWVLTTSIFNLATMDIVIIGFVLGVHMILLWRQNRILDWIFECEKTLSLP